MRTFQPDLIVLDLMLPKMSGVDVIKQVRSEADFAKLPIIVFSNTYLTNMIQEAWKAGANKCLSKTNCSPKEVLEVVRQTIGGSGADAADRRSRRSNRNRSARPNFADAEADADFQAELRKTFIDSLPATLATLRAGLQSLIKADNEADPAQAHSRTLPPHPRPHRQRRHRRLHPRSRKCPPPWKRCSRNFTKNRKTSTPPPSAPSPPAVDFLGFLFERGTQPDKQDMPAGQHPGGGRRSRFPAAPSFTPWKRPSSNPSTSKTRTPPSNCCRKTSSTSSFWTWTCPA